jgi:hypothetical protein
MKILTLLIFIIPMFLLGSIQGYAQLKESVTEEINYIYPDNKVKTFTETVDQFYVALRNRSYPVHQEFYKKHYDFYKKNKNKLQNMDTALFKELPNASVNFRKKVLFHEVEKFNYITWDGNGIPISHPDIEMKSNQAISPNRQVYFFYSLVDTDREFRGRCAVYDVETKQLLAGGGTYIKKYIQSREN